MVTTVTPVIAPHQLILPIITTMVPSVTSPGTIFISGTQLCFISGTALFYVRAIGV